MFGLKIIKETRYTELLVKENALNSRVKNSGVSTYEGLRELKDVILNEYNDVKSRLRRIESTFKTLKK